MFFPFHTLLLLFSSCCFSFKSAFFFFFFNCFLLQFCMHWIEGCGVGPHRNGFLRGTNRDIVIKWDDMCNDRLQSLFSFLLADFILLSGLAIVILTISKQAAFASIAIVVLSMAKSLFFFFFYAVFLVFSVAFIGI